MTLSEFIRLHKEEIMQKWETFAKTVPVAKNFSQKILRNHISMLLDFIADDIATGQTALEQTNKSQGQGETDSAEGGGITHGDVRFLDGFDVIEMSAEFRALRASVLKLWQQHCTITEGSFDEAERFNEAIDQLQMESLLQYNNAINQARALLLGTLVHDMRNPLGAVSNSVELLKVIGKMDDEQLQLVEQIGRSTSTVAKLVSDLIDATRLHLGRGVPLKRASMEMGESISRAVAEANAMQPTREIIVRTEGNLQGEWDGSRIAQVLSNLVGNALQHGSPDTPIEVAARENSGGVSLSVHSKGTPIATYALATVFDPLTRGEEEEQEKSSSTSLGLGLFISKEIVAAHGGKIDVTSTEEDGTTFVAWLPRSFHTPKGGASSAR